MEGSLSLLVDVTQPQQTMPEKHNVQVAVVLLCDFYSVPQCSHCKLCTSYGNSVRPSIRLSHAGIVSKRRHGAVCTVR